MCFVFVVLKGFFNVIVDDLGYLIGIFFMWSVLLFYKEYKEIFVSWILMKCGNS